MKNCPVLSFGLDVLFFIQGIIKWRQHMQKYILGYHNILQLHYLDNPADISCILSSSFTATLLLFLKGMQYIRR